MTIRVVVVDDQQLVRTGFGSILASEDDIELVGEASNGAEALDVCRNANPDLVVMDIRMPVMDGVEATRRLLAEHGDTAPRVLILTTFDLDELVHAALRAGASGFLLKDAPPDELFRAVRAIAAGDALIAPSVTRRLLGHFAASGPSAASTEAQRAVETLTGREREVLQLIARGRSNQEIAATMFVAETTVKTHVGRIFMKLAARDRIQATVVAYDAGLVVPGTD
jgi:DNA-binding NarL/FixJ family response regulator